MIRFCSKSNKVSLWGIFLLAFTIAFVWPTPLKAAPAKKILYVYGVQAGSIKENDESYERMVSTLDGMGLPYDVLALQDLGRAPLTNYQLVVVASSFLMNYVPDTAEQTIIDSINQGVHFLWIGPGIWGKQTNPQLPKTFGLTYISYGQSGLNQGEFVDLTGSTVRFSVKNENITRVALDGASGEGSYYIDNNIQTYPFITSYQEAGKGKTVFISMNIMDWWKDTEAEDTYARTEVLVKYIRKLTSQGYVAKHSVKNGKEANFLLRLEDYTPGGNLMLGNPTETWIDRLDNLIYFLKNKSLRLNIAVIPRYAHPCLGETHTWSDADQGIPLLKRYAQTVQADGGTLIAHGYKHQVGIGEMDFSGGVYGYEMCLFPTDQVLCDQRANTCSDPLNPSLKTYLSYADQKNRTDNARAEMALQFNHTPLVWETPHYAGNQDTYRAAAESGFQYFTESDTMVFPNYFGYLNRAQGLIMNIPETGFDFSIYPTINEVSIKKDYILPRLVRLNAPYYIFYHNSSYQQYQALVSVINQAQTYYLWYPSLEEFGMFWKSRDKAVVEVDLALKKITAGVKNAFEGLTLTFRLPDGASPGTVFINGLPAGSINKLVDGVQLQYVVLPAGTATTVEVNYH